MTAQPDFPREEAHPGTDVWGRLVESAVGAHLANAAARGECELFYWRQGNDGVDFVVRCGGSVTAIEVKSGAGRGTRGGLAAFTDKYEPDRRLLVGGDGVPVEGFLLKPVDHWVA